MLCSNRQFLVLQFGLIFSLLFARSDSKSYLRQPDYEMVDFDNLMKMLKLEIKICFNPEITSEAQRTEIVDCAKDHPCKNCGDGLWATLLGIRGDDGHFNCDRYIEKQVLGLIEECCLRTLLKKDYNAKLRKINDCQLRAFNSTIRRYGEKGETAKFAEIIVLMLESFFNLK